MTRAKTAPAEPKTPLQLKAEAIRRVQARRRAPRYGEAPNGLGGTVRWQMDTGTEFATAETIGEWVDDRVSRCPVAEGPCNTLILLFEHLRGGVDAVPDAVTFAASHLRDDHERFAVWAAFDSAPGGGPEIDAVKTRLAREWRRRGLPVTPGAPLQLEPTEWNRPSEQARRVMYKTPLGNPA